MEKRERVMTHLRRTYRYVVEVDTDPNYVKVSKNRRDWGVYSISAEKLLIPLAWNTIKLTAGGIFRVGKTVTTVTSKDIALVDIDK